MWTQSSFNLFLQWIKKQNIFKHLLKHFRLLNKHPPWIVRTLHWRSLFKRPKSYILVAEFHFLVSLKILGLKYYKAWFPWSRLSGKDSKQSCSPRPFKKYVFYEWGRRWKKWQKATRVEGVLPDVDVTFSNFSFFQFLFNRIFDPPYLKRFW